MIAVAPGKLWRWPNRVRRSHAIVVFFQRRERAVTDGMMWVTTGERRAYHADRLGKPCK